MFLKYFKYFLTISFFLFIHNIIAQKISDSKSYNEKIKYVIPVKFWIIQKDENDKKINSAYIKELIQYLNYYYSINNTGIRFSLRPDYEYINKRNLLQLRYFLQAPFLVAKLKSRACINVIITGQLTKKKIFGIRKKNFAGTYNSVFHSIIISRNISTSTLSHEIGHYLGLKHPHKGWKYKWFQEPVSRTKKTFLGKKMCEKRGDKLCDTPAEPNLTKYTDKNCNYTGWNVTDKFGEVYKPNTHNIMSYTNNRECRNKFTEGQIKIMHKTLLKNKYNKLWRTDLPENKVYLPDSFEPDNHKETASEIFFNTPQTHSFHKTLIKKNKKYNIPDTVDWMFFELKTKKKQNITISFTKINKFFPLLEIKIYNKDKIILNKKINEPHTFTIKALYSGIYSIKISNKNSEYNNNMYKIKIVK